MIPGFVPAPHYRHDRPYRTIGQIARTPEPWGSRVRVAARLSYRGRAFGTRAVRAKGRAHPVFRCSARLLLDLLSGLVMRTSGVREEATLPASTLPANPSLEQLRKQAKEFRSAVRTGHLKFTTVARQFHPRTAHLADTAAGWASFRLADAQLVVARCYGFASWGWLRIIHNAVGPQRPAGG